MKIFNIDSLPSQDWLMLGLDQLDAPYHAIVAGKPDLADMEAYCAGIRFSLFEFGAHSRRSPGRFDDTARALILMSAQVLKAAHAAGTNKPYDPKWDRVIKAITNHRKQFQTRLDESLSAQRAILATRKRETQRLSTSRWGAVSLYPIR